MDVHTIAFNQEDPIQIRFNDIDLLGHVNNTIIQEYFDLGRMNYLKKAFNGQLFEGEKAMIIASINTDFLMPVFMPDEIVVRTSIVGIGNKSVQMEQHLVDTKTNDLKTVCKSVLVAIDKETQQAVEVPKDWRDRILAIEQREM